MISSISNIFRVPELRKSIMITIGFLLIYRVGWNIPIPGVDIGVLKQLGEQSADSGFMAMLQVLSGGNLNSPALFALGIMPYISASIIFSLLTKVMPSLEAVAKEGAAGQRKINQWTRWSTVPLAMLQAILITVNIFQVEISLDGRPAYLLPPGFGYALVSIFALTVGTVFLMWIGEQITEYGVGNGISLLIMAGIVAQVPSNFVMLVDKVEGAFVPFALGVLFIVIVVVVVYITKGTRKIPVQYAKLMRGRRTYGGQRHNLPIKVNQAGVMPVIFASALLSFPSLVAPALGWDWLGSAFMPGSWWYTFLSVIMIMFFSFFWNSLMFNPVEMSKNMKEQGSFVPGIRPGKRTAEFLNKVMTRVTLAGASFLALIAIVPQWMATLVSAEVPLQIAYFLSGTSILITVSVALDLVDKLNSQLMMRSYDGFMGGGGSGSGSRRRRS